MSKDHLHPITFISVPDVGDGNPSAALAVQRLLSHAGHPTEMFSPALASVIGSSFHRSISKDPDTGMRYTKDSESKRHRALKTFGTLTHTEWAVHRFVAHHNGNTPSRLVVIQEHQLGTTDAQTLKRLYPDGAYLIVPDVYPKDSAITVMRQTDISPVVWNEKAYEKLHSIGLDPLIVAPHILSAFALDQSTGELNTNRIVVKSSGSGMPKEYVTPLLQALHHMDVEFTIYLPDRVITHKGEAPLHMATRERITTFYHDIIANPPKVLISLPSEMIQVMAELHRAGTIHMSLPPRGAHEAKNLQFAQEVGLSSVEMRPHEATKRQLLNDLHNALQSRQQTPDEKYIGITKPCFTQVLNRG